jgi:hypothetical protein
MSGQSPLSNRYPTSSRYLLAASRNLQCNSASYSCCVVERWLHTRTGRGRRPRLADMSSIWNSPDYWDLVHAICRRGFSWWMIRSREPYRRLRTRQFAIQVAPTFHERTRAVVNLEIVTSVQSAGTVLLHISSAQMWTYERSTSSTPPTRWFSHHALESWTNKLFAPSWGICPFRTFMSEE